MPDTIDRLIGELFRAADQVEADARRQQERIARLTCAVQQRDAILATNGETLERAIATRRIMRDRLNAEIEDLTQERNEALAVCYAVEEWIHGRLTADQVQETWRNVYGRQPAEAPAG